MMPTVTVLLAGAAFVTAVAGLAFNKMSPFSGAGLILLSVAVAIGAK